MSYSLLMRDFCFNQVSRTSNLLAQIRTLICGHFLAVCPPLAILVSINHLGSAPAVPGHPLTQSSYVPVSLSILVCELGSVPKQQSSMKVHLNSLIHFQL